MADTGAALTGNVVTSGPPMRTILKLALPTVGAMVSQAFVNFVDNVLCGRLPTEESSSAQAALLPSVILLWIFGGSLSAIGVGTQALVARRFAEKNDLDIGKVVYNAALFSLIAGIAFTVLGYVTLDPILNAIMKGDKVAGARGAAHDYMAYRLIGISSMSLTAAFKAFFDGMGKTYVHFWSAVVMNVFNVTFAYLFIFGNATLHIPHLGLAGAGLAAVVSTWVGLGIMIAFALHGNYRKRFRPFRLANYDKKLLWQILKLSIPGAIATIAVMTGFLLFCAIAAKLDTMHPVIDQALSLAGEVKYKAVKMAATTTTVEVLHLTFTACLGFGTATATLVSQSLGEKAPEKAERFGWASVKLGIMIFGVIGLFEAIFASNITAFMSHSDVDVQVAARYPLMMMGFATPLIATAMILTQALFGAGNTRFVMVVELILHFFCLVPLAWLLGVTLDLGIVGLWAAAIVYIVFLAIIMSLKFKQGTWKSIKI